MREYHSVPLLFLLTIFINFALAQENLNSTYPDRNGKGKLRFMMNLKPNISSSGANPINEF